MKATIRTNRQWRHFVYRHDVPSDVLERYFDWTDPETEIDGFFRYQGVWYHVSQFQRCFPTSQYDGARAGAFDGWDGYTPDSFFSGVLIRFSDDGESYQVGRYCV
jgi:hypothetical protein